MSIFRKKCRYCRIKIEKGKEIGKHVKIPGYIGKHLKHFCSNEHAEEYEKEVEEHLKNSRTKQGGCCG